jgi:AraC-like DNA-binding protein
MIAGCIERMRSDGCGGCERRDACAQLFAMFAARPPGERAARDDHRGEAGPRDLAGTLFRSLLGEVAKAVERRVEKARAEAASRAAAAAFAEAPAHEARRDGESGPVGRAVEAWLEPRLAAGELGVGAAARALGCSRQTLYRRLKAEGTTFEAVLDGLRRRLARRYLREQGLSVKEAAWRLGFSDPAAFSRAFKRWTGHAPTAGR